jgi:hypothetical protein
VSTYHEYLGHTDPNDASSVFGIEQIGLDETRWIITFQGRSQRGYEVQTTSDLTSDTWQTIWEVAPLSEDVELTLQLPLEEESKFIRLQAFQ